MLGIILPNLKYLNLQEVVFLKLSYVSPMGVVYEKFLHESI